ncbi:ferritin heavy chain-like [Neodiprion pinetum]|uniref:Ferritin n=1 Tax=Neodiprion lecontei TaxID=441921 RepID=A0A6J0BI30_NEOLC|nr:ferritin subunit [Neodiprion lecontei]XP_046419469.1 ferritin subunit-like [Neodiprion fabricii]XP_046475792.1 ferritin subunit-like [Neodiprion pinetum]XP_046613326.1 ferritin subunit-like [Neodiprion virginianus]
MNFIYGFLLVFGFVYVAPGVQSICQIPDAVIDTPWIDMVDSCTEELKDQVKMEIGASMTYLAMGAYFSRDSVSRPGFSKLFMQAADEEREHAIKLIEYMLMRGDVTRDFQNLLPASLTAPKLEWRDGVQALKDALAKEVNVTTNIRKVITNCETPPNGAKNDYHLVDYLTADFLDEQYRGQRDLAGKYTTLRKMMDTYGPIGEFLFDKKLLNGEL